MAQHPALHRWMRCSALRWLFLRGLNWRRGEDARAGGETRAIRVGERGSCVQGIAVKWGLVRVYLNAERREWGEVGKED
jgi:hypothetical protein